MNSKLQHGLLRQLKDGVDQGLEEARNIMEGVSLVGKIWSPFIGRRLRCSYFCSNLRMPYFRDSIETNTLLRDFTRRALLSNTARPGRRGR
jgi:hypothetical protein